MGICAFEKKSPVRMRTPFVTNQSFMLHMYSTMLLSNTHFQFLFSFFLQSINVHCIYFVGDERNSVPLMRGIVSSQINPSTVIFSKYKV